MTRATTSASNLHRRAVCPGSERLEAGLPEEESEQAAEGTLLHAFDADRTRDQRTLTPDQRDLLKISADLEEFVFQTAREHFGIAEGEPYTQGNEETLHLHKGIRSVLEGHCDRWRHYHRIKLLIILDKKYGYRPVTPAAANKQLRGYAVMGAERWPAENVVVAINQPRLPYAERVSLAIYTRDDLAAARGEIYAILDAVKKPEAPLVAGEEQCRYCKARTTCPAFQEAFQGGLKLIPFPAQGESVAKREATISAAVAALTDEQLDRMLLALQMAGYVADPARDEARRRVASGRLTTYKLGKTSEVRSVADPERAIALLTMPGGPLNREETLSCCAPSLTKLETKYREKTGATWQEARETIDSMLAPVLERTEKKPILTRVK